MRIGFDISPLVRPYPEGVARACRGLLRALEEHSVLDVLPLAPEAGESERHWRHGRLPREMERLALEGFHSPISAFPWRGPGRRVSTVHELPWCHGVKENAGASHRFWAHFGVGRADAVLCPSEHVRGQLIAACGGAAQVLSCPWGSDPSRPSSGEQQALVLERFGLRGVRFALAVGATRPKKNLRGVLRALAWRRRKGQSGLRLVVTGNPTRALAEDLALAAEWGLAAEVQATGHVSAEELDVLQSRASLALVLAHSEGFSFPALDALHHGTPLVVTAHSAQAEVAGRFGLGADANCAESMARAMERALARAPAMADERRQRAAEFSWERAARTVQEVWMGWART